MSDDEVSRQLEYLAARVRDHGAYIRRDEHARLLERLSHGESSRRVEIGPEPGPRPRFASGSPTDTLGNTSPFIGQANVLLDPVFAGDAVGGAFAAGGTAFGGWTAKYVLNSGAAVAPTINFTARAAPDANPFSSGQAQFAPTASGVSDLTIYLYPTTPFHPNYVDTLDYLVGAMRVHYPFGFADAIHYTTITATLEIYNATTPAVVASSIDYDLLATSPPILVAAYQSTNSVFRSTDWLVRLKLRLVTTGAYNFLRHILFGEPQLHFAYTPDPVPFQPAIANWLVREGDISLSDVTTDDVTSAKHGFAPKAPADATKFLNGTGAWSVPTTASAQTAWHLTASETIPANYQKIVMALPLTIDAGAILTIASTGILVLRT